jgi:gluconate 2-dehydrogenase gamma chain
VSEMNRRDVLKLLALAPIAGSVAYSPPQVAAAWLKTWAARDAGRSGPSFEPTFFTPREWETVRILVDLILPADERSGSATDAGVPEFMDFIVDDNESLQTPIRGGLAWLDGECRRRFEAGFSACTDSQRTAVLDDIAWPARAAPEYSQGVAFFNRFRDLTASGFFSSRMGVEDLQYMGNRLVPEWTGCPPEVMDHLGLSYEEWDERHGGDHDG